MDTALILCRFLQYGAAMLIFGIAAFAGFIAPDGLRDRFGVLTGRVSAMLALVIALTAVGWFMLEAAEAGNGWADAVSPDTLAALAVETAFGQAWIWHLACVAVLLIGLGTRGNARRWAALVASVLVLASLGLVGHAAMQDGAIGMLHRLNDILHLLSSGFWVGCLVPLLVCLMQLRGASSRADSGTALRRFSGLGHVAVALALVTGLLNTTLVLHHLPLDPGSPYQLLLAIKIGLVLVMVGLALVNRYVTTPRLAFDAPRALRALAFGTAGEIVLGAIVIALVSAFATFDPV